MSRRSSKSTPPFRIRGTVRDRVGRSAGETCSAWGGIDLYGGKLGGFTEHQNSNRPDEVGAQIARTRYWYQENWFVETVVLLKLAFLNFQLELKPADKGAKTAFKKWEEGNGGRLAIEFIEDAVREWLVTDNLVSFWRDKAPFPYPLRAEHCKYSDVMGKDELWTRIMLDENTPASPRDIEGIPGLTAEQKKRFATGWFKLDRDKGEEWLILRRGSKGYGFCRPRLYREFRTLSQNESMEVGEDAYAYAGRTVVRQHGIGFEVKASTNAPKQDKFYYSKSRAEEIKKFFQGAKGFTETVTPFDHKIGYVWIDPKNFDGRKWETTINRLLPWSGPLGFMLYAKTLAPNLLPMLRTECLHERDLLRRHLQVVIDEALKPPGGVKISWSAQCFKDERLAWDIIKGLLTAGNLSNTTALEQTGNDPVLEVERKQEEAKNPEAYLPLFDPNHGTQQGRPGPTKGARNRPAEQRNS